MDPAHANEDRRAVMSFYESHPMIFDGTRRTVSLAAWLYDMELIFHLCHIEERLQVSLASRCLAVDVRLWWMTIGEREMPSRTWAHFRALLVARYGPIPDEGADEPYRNPAMYRDTYHARYLSFSVVWHAYPQEPMSHYCRRFQEELLPYVPQDLANPVTMALQTFRDGLPHQIRQYVPIPMPGTTVGNMIDDILEAEAVMQAMQVAEVAGGPQAPVDEAGMGEPPFEADPAPPQDAEADMAVNEFDNFLVDLEDQPLDPNPLIIDISSDDEEEIEPAPEIEHAGWLENDDVFDYGEDPEEIVFHDGAEESDSDTSSVVTIEPLE